MRALILGDVPTLQFPVDRNVGVLSWNASFSEKHGPVLAVGPVTVPDLVAVSLHVQTVLRSNTNGGGWSLDVGPDPVDLGFLRDLPADSIDSLTLHGVVEDSFGAVAHLAPALHRLYLAWSGLTDAVLETVAGLTGLTWLQTFGNAFTDHGVQQLASLANLTNLYLEEESLTLEAFAFVDQLPVLERLGVQDAQLDDTDLEQLRARLDPVVVAR